MKERLRAATDEAYERGVRGVPTIAVGDELFYGDDQLEKAAAAAADRGAVPHLVRYAEKSRTAGRNGPAALPRKRFPYSSAPCAPATS